MKTRHFVFLILLYGIISEVTYLSMETLKVLSIIVHIISGVYIGLIIYYYKIHKIKCMELIVRAILLYTEYIVIIAVGYLRIIDIIIEDGLVAIISTIILASIFAVIIYWNDVKKLIYKDKK